MNGEQEKSLTRILLEIKGEVGQTKGKVEAVCEDVGQIKEQMTETVRRGDCTDRHKILEAALARELQQVRVDFRQGVDALKGEMRSRPPTPPSGQYQPAGRSPSSRGLPAVPPIPTVDQIEKELAQREEERKDRRRRFIAWALGVTLTSLTIIGILGGVLWKITSTLHQVNQTLQTQPQTFRAEMKEELKRAAPRVIYVDRTEPEPALNPSPPHRHTPKKAASPDR